jgi:taurine dioxygenase
MASLYTITPLTAHTGAEIRGLDLRQPIDADTRAALNRAFADHHVLVVRDQQYEPGDFRQAVQLWGELQPHDKKEMHVPGFPEMYYVSNQEFLGTKRLIPGETFHTDHSNHPAPPKATILYPVDLPTSGGDTQYVNMHLAYDALPAAMKQKIDGLKAVHVYLSKYSPRALKPLTEDSLKTLPPPGIHPLVRVHPENRRKALFLNPVRIESIVGMPDDEALDLVARLMEHATQKKYEYRHQ